MVADNISIILMMTNRRIDKKAKGEKISQTGFPRDMASSCSKISIPRTKSVSSTCSNSVQERSNDYK